MESTFVYIPKTGFNLGDLGSHPLTISATMRKPPGRHDLPQVQIETAFVAIRSIGKEQFIDVMHVINFSMESREAWEAMVLTEYRRFQQQQRETLKVVGT